MAGTFVPGTAAHALPMGFEKHVRPAPQDPQAHYKANHPLVHSSRGKTDNMPHPRSASKSDPDNDND
jgi:hypothetical protein